MYFLIHKAPSPHRSAKPASLRHATASAVTDFLTPDGTIVPRAAGEAALERHTAVLIGGLLVGGWS